MSQKEALAEKYQKLLQDAREDLKTATDAHRSEQTAFLKQLHSQNDSAFSKLKEAAMDASEMKVPELAIGQDQLIRLHELEDLVKELERTNSVLIQQVEQVRQEEEQTQRISHTQLLALQKELIAVKQNWQSEVKGKFHGTQLMYIVSHYHISTSPSL